MNSYLVENSVIIQEGIKQAVLWPKRSSKVSTEYSKQMSMIDAAMSLASQEIEAYRTAYPCFTQTISELENAINQEVIGQEDTVAKIVYVAYMNQVANFLEEIGCDAPKRINLLLIGPTGSGKTLCIRALKKYFSVPVATYHADSVTSAGFVGNSVEDILLRLYEQSGKDLAKAERGVIFIDEIDKKREEQTTYGRDINGKAVQQELLKILEPNIVDVELPNRSVIHFDTSRLTVFMGGAFVGLDDIKKKRLAKKRLGFMSKADCISDEEVEKSPYELQDIIDYGFIPEFVGRFGMISVLKKLTFDDMMQIILNSKASPYREKTQLLCETLNVELQVSMEFIKNVAKELADSKTGARALQSRMENFFYPITYYAMRHRGEYGICFIDDEGSFELMYDDIVYYG